MLAGACLAFVPDLQAQLLRNGSFEEAETEKENPYGDLAAHWGRWGNWMNRETYWQPTHNGVALLGYHHWRIEEDSNSGFFQDIPAVPAGAAVEFSIFAFKDRDTNAEFVELRLEPLNGGEALASQVYPIEQVKMGGWGKIMVTGKNPKPGLRVLVICRPRAGGGRAGAIKFDDAVLTAGGASAAP